MKLAPRAESAGANLMFRGATTGAPNFAANAVGRVGQFLREPGARALRGIGAWGERQIAGAQASGRVAAAVKRMNMMARQAEANRVAGAAVGKSMQQAARGKTWFRPGAGGFFGNSRLSKTLNIGNAAAAASLPAVIADRKRELDNVGDYAAAKAVYAIQKKPWHARLAMGFAPELTAQELAKTNPQAANYLRYLQSQEPQSRFGDFLNILKPSS